MPEIWEDDKIISKIKEWWQESETEIQDSLDRQKVALELYMANRRKDDDELPWKGSSNLDIGGMNTQSHVEAIHSRIMSAMEKSDPMVHFISEDKDSAVNAGIYFTKKLNNEVGILEVCDEWFRQSLIAGIGIVKPVWETEDQHVAESWTIQLPGNAPPEITNQFIIKTIIDRLSRLFRTFTIKPKSEDQWEVIFNREGKTLKGTLTYEMTRNHDVKVTIHYIKRTYDGAKVYQVEPENFRKSKGPIQSCHHVIHRVWLTWNQIISKVKTGEYEGIDLEQDQGAFNKPSEPLDIRRDEFAGITPRENLYEFQECYILDDFGGDGILEDRIITFFVGKQKIVKNILKTEAGYKYRPFSIIIIQKIPGRPDFGIGVPSMVLDAADEETAIHNLIMDASTLAAIKFYFYSQDSPQKGEQHKIVPGKGVALPTPGTGRMSDAVYIPEFSANLQPLFMLQQRLDQIMQSVDGVGETQLMKKPLARTLGQSTLAQNELNIRFSRIFSRCMGTVGNMTGVAGLLTILAELYREFGQEMDIIQKSGGMAKIGFPKSSELDIQLNVDINKLNEINEQKKAQAVFQVVHDPNLMQMGIVRPSNIYNAAKDFLNITATINDVDRYISKPPDLDQQSIPQNKENVLMLHGLETPVKPSDKDQEHLRDLAVFMELLSKNPEMGGPKVMQLLQEHQQGHQKNMQTKQQKMAQMAQMTQMMKQEIGSGVPSGAQGGAGQVGGFGNIPGAEDKATQNFGMTGGAPI